MEDTEKTILFGLKMESDRLRKEIEKTGKKLNKADNHEDITELGFKKQILIDKHEDILEDIRKRDALVSGGDE